MSSQDLTKEQRQRIEENKQRALARRAEKVSPMKVIQKETRTNAISVVTSFPENNSIKMKLKIETNTPKTVKKHNMQLPIGVKEQLKTASQGTHLISQKTASQGTHLISQSVVRNINMNVVNECDSSIMISIKKKTNEAKHPSFSKKEGNFRTTDQLNVSHNDRGDLNTNDMPTPMRPKAFYDTTQKIKGTCILTDNRMFYVDVGYCAPLIDFFKQMKTKIYDNTKKLWSFKLEEYNTFMNGVGQFKPDIEIEGLPPWILQTFGSSTSESSEVFEADLKCVDDVLVQTLMPFQKHGVNVAIQRQGRLLIADDMGLGKTLQAICIASYYRKEWPLLVVCPSSVRFDWSQQICKWLPSVPSAEINVVDSGKKSAISGLVNIISYDILSKKTSELNGKRFKVIIMDESHFLKNAKTARTRAAMPLLKLAKRVLLLSGTPALSRPCELFCQIIGVCPDIFKFHNFGLRYCNAKQMPWGWDYSGSSNMIELQLFLERKVMIRRQKKDVLSQLPAKTRQVVVLDATSVRKNKGLVSASKLMEKGHLKGMERRGVLLEYFHETCKVKLNPVREYLLDLIESEKKFLVFAHHKEMLDNIEDCIKSKASNIKYIRIDGRTASEQRNYFCRQFQSKDEYKVAILSVTAANAGLNLCAANLVVFAELFWNPGILVQAEDRVHRIGQADSVSVQYLVARGTADDYIWPLVQDKLNTLSKAGLTKDDFSDASTKVIQIPDSSQLTILDMFKSDFIDESPVNPSSSFESQESDMTVLFQTETLRKAKDRNESSPVKKTSPLKKKTPIKFKGPKTELTPNKRQASLTDFFPSTPPKKILRLDDDACNRVSEESPQNNTLIENSQKEAGVISQDDIVALESLDWDDDL